jgi:hypothetical protein
MRPDGPARPVEAAFLGALFLAGVVHWVLFFGLPPRLPPSVGDWAKERRYYTVLRQAVREGRVPYYVSRPIQGTRKFLANPEVVLSPQVLFLRFLEVEPFVAVQTVLAYTAGFVGCSWLRRRYRLSLLPFTLLFLVFNFNGHLTAHLAVGHSMWAGGFLLPFFFLYMLELIEGRDPRRTPVKLALALFAILLQGALHVFNWCVLLLVLTAAFRWRLAGAVARTLLWAGVAGACRLLPAAVVWSDREVVFLTGYPGLGDLASALLTLRPPDLQKASGLNVWEYDAFVGPLALAWIVAFGVARMPAEHRSLRGPLAVMVLLSLGSFYYVVHVLKVPLLNAERASSRLLIVPVLLLAVLAAIATERDADRLGRHRIAAWAVAVATAVLLATHSVVWSLPSFERVWPPPPHQRDLAIQIVNQDPSGTERGPRYVAGVRAAFAVTAGALVVMVRRLRNSSGRSPA